jgi:hypothetical protein
LSCSSVSRLRAMWETYNGFGFDTRFAIKSEHSPMKNLLIAPRIYSIQRIGRQ